LIEATRSAIFEVTGVAAQLNTAGGTSDGRFIAPTGAEVVELGPVNDTIHKINERVRLEDLDTLSTIYERVLEKLLA
jgi:succinyl-diaminopimelate desuccinylase